MHPPTWSSLFSAIAFANLSTSQYTAPSYANFSGPDGPLVDLGYLQVQGTRLTSSTVPINAWLGIQYGAAPTGDRRFKPPMAIETAESVEKPIFDATAFGPICYQGWPGWSPESPEAKEFQAASNHFGNRQESEDCLLLDIYAPGEPVSESLPVLVIIHGGGYVAGGSTTIPSPAFMAAAPGQFIVVNIQYRLSGFGFLGGAGNGTLNAGLHDQRLALEWIQRHIASFGGDPNQVTISGGSAGGGSVFHQLIWNGGEEHPPYRAAIAEYPWVPTIFSPSQLEQQYQEVLFASNCSDLSCLQSLSADEYNRAQNKALLSANTLYGMFYFSPAIDGHYIQDFPTREAEAGHFAKVSILTTRDGNEGFAFTPQDITTEAQYQDRVQQLFNGGANFFGRLQDYYPPEAVGPFAYKTTQQRVEFITGDAFIQCPSYRLASSTAEAFSLADPHDALPVYKLIYGYPTYDTAYHGAYTYLVFPTQAISANDTSVGAEIGRKLQQYYSSFIINGDPNIGLSSSDVEWPEYGSSSDILYINSSTPIQMKDIDADGRCDFLLSRVSVTAN